MERDYKKLYEKAFKRAKEDYDNVNTSNCERRRLETIFPELPELKESEDEGIRKKLIQFFEEVEHTSTWSEEDEDTLNTIVSHIRNDGRYSSPDLANEYADFVLSLKPNH